MQIIEFVKKHLGEHRIKGKEIIVKKCPFCGREKHKFYLNTEKGLYQCFSGSCRQTGHINKLYEKYNEKLEAKFISKELDIKQYIRKTTLEAKKWLNSRGISDRVIDNNIFDIMSTATGDISFIYRKNFEVHSIKTRSIKEKTFGGKKLKDLTLWKLDFCDTELPLIICEGEIDQLSYEEQNINNAVSVPAGAGTLSWIDTDYEILEKFKTVILSFDNDAAGKEAVKKIIKRLPEEIDIKVINFIDNKDANEVILSGGKLADYVDRAESISYDEIIKMCDVDAAKQIERYSTGISKMNKSIGGIRMGEVSVWTGQAGSGKSTILNQVMLSVMEQGVKCMIYTPELTDVQYKDWTTRQLLDDPEGSFVKNYCNIRERDVFYVKKSISDKMSLWIDEYLVNVTAKKNYSDKEILKTIIRQIKKNNVKFIVIDNLMKLIFDDYNNEYNSQKQLLNSLSEICKQYNVSINLVAHPKKHNKSEPDQYDIMGSSNIPNLVDNIYYFRRVTDWCVKNDLKAMLEEITLKNISTLMMILKSRDGEKIGTWIDFCFDTNKKVIFGFDEGYRNMTKWKSYDSSNDDIPDWG